MNTEPKTIVCSATSSAASSIRSERGAPEGGIRPCISSYFSAIASSWFRFLGYTEGLGRTYRTTVLSQAFLSFLVLLVNLTVLIVSTTKYPVDHDGTGTVYVGNCQKIQRANSAAHIIINLLSTTVLSASNYCMQCVVAPSRHEINKAHGMRRLMDIGVHSLRNLGLIPRPRVIVWALLALSSVPLHLLYNSAVFKTEAGIQYDYVLVREEFFDQRDLNSTGGNNLALNVPLPVKYRGIGSSLFKNATGVAAWSKEMQRFADEGPKWHNLTVRQCMNQYGRDFVTNYSTLLLVTKTPSPFNQSVANGTWLYWDQGYQKPRSYSWMCGYSPQATWSAQCDPESVLRGEIWPFTLNLDKFNGSFPLDPVYDNSSNGYTYKVPFEVDYCLAEPVTTDQQYCELKYSRFILITVCVMNTFKGFCMVYIALAGWHQEPLLTVGDAVSSFLEEKDPHTKGLHDWSKRDFRKWAKNESLDPNLIRKKKQKYSRRWIHGASKGKWITCMFLSSTVIGAAGGLFGSAVEDFYTDVPKDDRWKTTWRTGIGNFNPSSTIHGLNFTDTPIWAVVISNLPQLILSFLYLQYNSIFTSMLAEAEWTTFSQKPARLRVTFPKPGQKRTEWLELPFQWGLPLALLSFLLHWLVSEAIFFAQMTIRLGDITMALPTDMRGDFFAYSSANSITHVQTSDDTSGLAVSAVGYNIVGIALSIIVGCLALVVALLIGIFKIYSSGLPIGGTCSAVISAACHGSETCEVAGAACLPVQWGDVVHSDGTHGKGFFALTEEEYSIQRELASRGTLRHKTKTWITERKVSWRSMTFRK